MKAINDYMSSKSYGLNESLRNGYPLDNEQKKLVYDLDIALKKLPTYKGDLTRSVYFDTDEDINTFISEYQVGSIKAFDEYISTTYGEIYNDMASILMYINNAEKGRDISMYNNIESEVLYERGSEFEVIDIEYGEGGIIEIELREV